MPIETQIIVAAIVLVFAFFMALLAWAERRAGGSFDDTAKAMTKPSPDQPDNAPEHRQAA